MFKSYVLPILEFSNPVFNPYYTKVINSLEKVQRDFLRMVYRRLPNYQKILFQKTNHLKPSTIHQNINSDILPSYPDLLATFGLELLELRRLKHCLRLFHSYLHGLIPIDSQAFRLIPNKTNENSFKIHVGIATRDARFNSFFIRIANIYKNIDPDLQLTNPDVFTNVLKAFDFSKFLKNSL